MASPGISYWLESTIHPLFHSPCPLGLITINLTPCLSDAAARSAGLGEMFTKAVDHQHFDCGTPNCHYSLCPRWSHQPSDSMISMQWLLSAPEPGKPTWRPVTLCLLLVLLFPLEQRCSSATFCLPCFVFQWMGSPCWLGLLPSHCFSLRFMYHWLPYYSLLPGIRKVYSLEFPTTCWSIWQFSVIVWKKEIVPPWLLLNWTFFLRWWWTIALWILVLCK